MYIIYLLLSTKAMFITLKYGFGYIFGVKNMTKCQNYPLSLKGKINTQDTRELDQSAHVTHLTKPLIL